MAQSEYVFVLYEAIIFHITFGSFTIPLSRYYYSAYIFIELNLLLLFKSYIQEFLLWDEKKNSVNISYILNRMEQRFLTLIFDVPTIDSFAYQVSVFYI